MKILAKLNKTKLRLGKSMPNILTFMAVGGVIGTVVLTDRAARKAVKKEEEAKQNNLTKVQTVLYVAQDYILPVTAAAGTITCVLGANVLNKRQQASLVTACKMLESSYKAYRRKTIDVVGPDKELEIRNAITKDKIENSNLQVTNGPFPYGDETILAYDIYGNRYFHTTLALIREAEYHLNRNMQLLCCVTLNDFYEFLGLEKTEYGKTVGWSIASFDFYGYQWIDFEHQKITTDDGLECYVIYYPFEPHVDYMEPYGGD